MIDFRYHLVSIVAVFLALAIGIVLGSTELQGPVYNALSSAASRTSSVLQDKLTNESNELSAAQQSVTADEAWLQANEAGVLHGLLTGQKLLIVTEPGAQPSVISGLTTAAADAGATVTGQIDLSSNFFNPSTTTSASLASLNTSLANQAGIQLDTTVSLQQQAAIHVLASSLLAGASSVGNQNGATSTASADTTLQAYGQAGYLTVPVGAPAAAKSTVVVLVTPQAIPADSTQDLLAQALGPIAGELAKSSSATVVAGSTAGSGGGSPISVLRGNSVSSQVSSVDDADTTIGQIAVVEALHNALAGGKPGAYGRQAGGSPVYPALTPGSAASTSPSATPSPTKKAKK